MTPTNPQDEGAIEAAALIEDEDHHELDGLEDAPPAAAEPAPPPPEHATPTLTAHEAAEQLLAWAAQHHLLDPLAVIAHGAPPVAPHDGTLFPSSGNTTHVLRTKQVAGVLYNDPERCVYVLTRKRVAERAMKAMPHWHGGIEVKYLYFGQAQSGQNAQAADQAAYREVHGRYACGSSIHPARYPGAGTLGCLLRDAAGQMYGLSCNHVSGLGNYADAGEKILAPGHNDITPAGRDPFTIGVHLRALPMTQGSPTNVDIQQNTDAAVFSIRDPEGVSSSQGGYYDTPAVFADPSGGMQVAKVGRTTSHTLGRITGISPTPTAVGYQLAAVGGNATVYFNDLVVAVGENGGAFSQPGDSGSLVVGELADGSLAAVGIVIAGTNSGLSLLLPIAPILEALQMTLVSGHHP